MKKALLIEPAGYVRGGGQLYAARVADWLTDIGYRVYMPALRGTSGIECLREGSTVITEVAPYFQDLVDTGVDLAIVTEPGWADECSAFLDRVTARRTVLFAYFYDWIRKDYIQRFDGVLTLSEFHAQYMRKNWEIEPTIIPAGFEPLEYKPELKTDSVISFGRLEEMKGHWPAMLWAKKILPDWPRMVVGWSLPTNEGLIDRLQDLGAEVVVDASVDAIQQYLQESSIGLFLRGLIPVGREAADYEGWGMALAESMSAGVVPVAFAAGGHLDIVAEGTGFLVHNSAEIKQALELLGSDQELRTKMALQASEHVRQFSLEKMRPKIMEFVLG
jgi:glycosyltransferase involved in cell wall biosynthesis